MAPEGDCHYGDSIARSSFVNWAQPERVCERVTAFGDIIRVGNRKIGRAQLTNDERAIAFESPYWQMAK